MAAKNITVRLKLRYDTLANWNLNDPVLLAGEIGIATMPAGGQSSEPSVLIKVGDGGRKFSQLEWLSAKAGDVYAWAKAATKPEYTVDEISGLTAEIDSIDSRIETLEDTASNLAPVATSGDVNSLTQASGDYMILNCGSATTVI